MPIIRLGPWRPDAAALDVAVTVNVQNVIPATNGFGPVGQLASGTDAVPGIDDIAGAATALAQDGGGRSFVGTSTKLHDLASDGSWTDRTRLSGGAYATPVGERWRFAQFTNLDTAGDLAIATNGVDDPQKLDLASGTNFEALGGSPGTYRYIATFGQRVLLANKTGLSARPNRVAFSAPQDPEIWDGSSLSGFQDITPGGPVTGLTSGEVAYIFQRNRITRMIDRPDDDVLKVQFDGIEERRGLEADNSLTEYGDLAFFLSQDGFYALQKRNASIVPIGNNKVDAHFRNDVRQNTRLNVFGSIDPVGKLVFWSYISKDNSGSVPDRTIIYDWGRQEWGRADFPVLALSSFITQGFTLDDLNPFGTLDSLPFPLDSPFWAGGNTILGIISTDRKLSNLSGSPLAATIDTREGTFDQDTRGRIYVREVAPLVDTDRATVAIGHRDRLGDAVTFEDATAMEADGFCPQHVEAALMRGRVQIPAGATWTLAEGIDPVVEPAGQI